MLSKEQIKAVEFVKQGLTTLIKEFPDIRARYEYDEIARLHYIEIVPKEIFDNNQLYINWENNFTDLFIENFRDQNIGFISDDTSITLDKIDFELEGKNFIPKYSITATDIMTISEQSIQITMHIDNKNPNEISLTQNKDIFVKNDNAIKNIGFEHIRISSMNTKSKQNSSLLINDLLTQKAA